VTEPEIQESADPEPVTEAVPETGRRDEIVYHSRHNDRMEIALSFDDGPHPRLTPVILDILAEYGIKATFFMVGENVGYYPAAAHAVAEAGHEIGNHTFSHRRFGRMGAEDMRREITACEEAISSLTEIPVRFIRPPEGEMSEAMRGVVGDMDYRIILWDVDTRDWAHTPPDQITRHILDTVQAGDIILMHDFIGYGSPTPEALRQVIPALLDRGFRFVTVGELVAGD
jgi:peptidoglycan/xylan/chitin deacetylase (PgdA/CDA1 family)